MRVSTIRLINDVVTDSRDHAALWECVSASSFVQAAPKRGRKEKSIPDHFSHHADRAYVACMICSMIRKMTSSAVLSHGSRQVYLAYERCVQRIRDLSLPEEER